MTTILDPSHPSKTRRKKDSPGVTDMSNVVVLVLGGGQGSRLFPLTQTRCKPALFFGGRYRLIDIPISNALNSGCNKIFVLTQFLSTSLHRHLSQTYPSSALSKGFVDILSAEQRPTQSTWYEGTADAVRQNLHYLVETPAEYFLVLSGDQIYNLNFQHLLNNLIQSNSDAVIAALPISDAQAGRMGVLKIDASNKILDFHEKPQDTNILESMRCHDNSVLGSMGIYLFRRQALINILQEDTREDFGKHLIPNLIKNYRTSAYVFDGYWEDIGTIESFYQANLALTKANPDFNCNDETSPIYSSTPHLPPTRFSHTKVHDSIICEGSIIEADEITNSIIGRRSTIRKGTVIRDSYLIGNEHYHSPLKKNDSYQIGEDCMIHKAIIDKDVRIGNGVKLINKQNLVQYNHNNHVYIKDGIIIIARGATLPDGFTL